MNIAFSSSAFTKNLYQGMVEVTPLRCSGLPDEDDNVEAALSGGGVDAKILVAAVEGQWKEDIELLKQNYHEGISDLTGAAHIGQSSVSDRQDDNRYNRLDALDAIKLYCYIPWVSTTIEFLTNNFFISDCLVQRQ